MASRSKRKSCPECGEDKICNEKTGRCVLKTGKIGKELLMSSGNVKKKSAEPDRRKESHEQTCPECDENKICNNKTGRCVLRTGKIGKELVAHGSTHSRRTISPKSKKTSKNKYNIGDPIKYDYLIGPTLVRQMYSSNYDKNILLLGDVHKKAHICQEDPEAKKILLTDMISSIILNNPDKVIDIFLEQAYVFRSNMEYPESTYLADIVLLLKNCTTWFRAKCEYPNVRAHFTDIRIRDTNNTPFEHYISSEELFPLLLATKNKDWKVLKGLIKPLLEAFDQSEIHSFLTESKAMKQFYNSVLSSDDADTVFRILMTEIRKGILSETDKNNIIRAFKKKNIGVIIDFMMQYMNFCAAFMDFYLISRLFKRHKDIPGQFSDPSKYIIIYAGQFHIEKYINILEQIGFITIFKSISETDGLNFQCPKISGMHQPVFSHAKE